MCEQLSTFTFTVPWRAHPFCPAVVCPGANRRPEPELWLLWLYLIVVACKFVAKKTPYCAAIPLPFPSRVKIAAKDQDAWGVRQGTLGHTDTGGNRVPS